MARPKLESKFQSEVIEEIKQRLPGSIVTKLSSFNHQGIPDILVLHNARWAALEAKRSKDSPRQPNQEWWVNKMNSMSFSSFIYPENKEEVLNALAHTLST